MFITKIADAVRTVPDGHRKDSCIYKTNEPPFQEAHLP